MLRWEGRRIDNDLLSQKKWNIIISQKQHDYQYFQCFSGGSVVKNQLLPVQQDTGSIPDLGRSQMLGSS